MYFNKKIPVAIIGAGRIGMLLEKDPKRVKPATHFGMWLNNRKANLVAICDRDKKKLKFAKKQNITKSIVAHLTSLNVPSHCQNN